MKLWALIHNSTVINVVEQEGSPSSPGLWVYLDGRYAGPGFTYDGTNFYPPAARVNKLITAEAFWDRFTNSELVDYDVAMQHDPAAGNPAKKAAAKLRIFRRETGEAGYRALGKTKVRDFVAGLEGSVLAAGRAAQILDAPVTDDEAFDDGK